MVELFLHERFEGVYWIKDEEEKVLATKNLVPGFQVYGEKLYRVRGEEYRSWIPYRSKLAAAIMKGMNNMFIKPGSRILYLGTATGTTSSHVSDIIGERGVLYGVEFAARVMIQFKRNVSDKRVNVIPIFSDARKPETYAPIVGEVDVIYCDVAQPEQAKLLSDNARLMLKSGGHGYLAVKARSIDSVQEPEVIYRREVVILEKNGLKPIEVISLEPYERDHVMVVLEYR
ncbi:MAG: fibrillarin-like rRNA/tRNA 2'-O-methyltransferase [Thaumarchaeota archaeon]|jgi:fibrillarin-like pre-rRNA processing protein|nr:fibrillarin-like rRNA/tRNA 2'-O-methyltransferase [Candidatus Wolframiiraptor allenii]